MSWDARLTDDRGHSEGDWNHTHNTAQMIYATLSDDNEYQLDEKESWYNRLDGMSGPEGSDYIERIIGGLVSDPERFRAMNPSNGWGDYDSLVKVLKEMRNAVPGWPTTWGASG